VKRTAPAAERNKQPLLDVLTNVLPTSGIVLEIASGTGQHAAFFASRLPHVVWQPSDRDDMALASIQAHVQDAALDNLRAPIRLDVGERPWPVGELAAILCVNMIHIAPWDTTLALVAGAAETLSSGGPLVLYGPYVIDGETAPSNIAFSERLNSEDPAWGVRELRDIEREAANVGLVLAELIPMPANNHVVVFRARA
jgi:SAM-dependent methyltransferase